MGCRKTDGRDLAVGLVALTDRLSLSRGVGVRSGKIPTVHRRGCRLNDRLMGSTYIASVLNTVGHLAHAVSIADNAESRRRLRSKAAVSRETLMIVVASEAAAAKPPRRPTTMVDVSRETSVGEAGRGSPGGWEGLLLGISPPFRPDPLEGAWWSGKQQSTGS